MIILFHFVPLFPFTFSVAVKVEAAAAAAGKRDSWPLEDINNHLLPLI